MKRFLDGREVRTLNVGHFEHVAPDLVVLRL
jgi:hypothetical protein